MKKLFTLIAIIVLTTINAQAPQGFNYQATGGLTPIVCFVTLGCSSRFNKLPFHRQLLK
jgi:hypothetical protein